MNMYFSNLIKYSISFIVAIFIAFLSTNIIYFYLPKDGINFDKQYSNNIEYRKYNLENSFEGKKIPKKIEKKELKYNLLKKIQLKAIYSTQGFNGWVIIEDKSKKTHILSVGESFKNYMLKKVYVNYVLFSKNNKEYKLSLKDDKKVSYIIDKKSSNINSIENEQIIVMDDKVTIKRAYLNKYIKNYENIWNDIAIKEIKNKNGKIDGFKINKISKNSVFLKLGLKKGDILKEINNIKLSSYNEAFGIYKKINKLKNLNIKILRNSKEMELNYEIK